MRIMTVAHIGKKHKQCVKHADSEVYMQCVYTDVSVHWKKGSDTDKTDKLKRIFTIKKGD
jgi:hypothetical protein